MSNGLNQEVHLICYLTLNIHNSLKKFNHFLAWNGIINVENGRLEVDFKIRRFCIYFLAVLPIGLLNIGMKDRSHIFCTDSEDR